MLNLKICRMHLEIIHFTKRITDKSINSCSNNISFQRSADTRKLTFFPSQMNWEKRAKFNPKINWNLPGSLFVIVWFIYFSLLTFRTSWTNKPQISLMKIHEFLPNWLPEVRISLLYQKLLWTLISIPEMAIITC